MKYFNTLIEEQETLINILYEEQLVSVYTNRLDVIQNLTEKIGQPTKKYRKSKTYWSGASWNIDFTNFDKLNKILNKELIIDNNLKNKEIRTKKKADKSSSEQYSFL